MKTVSILFLSILLLEVSPEKMLAQGARDTSGRNVIVDENIPGAQFPGGEREFKRFVRANIHPVRGANGKRVLISFIIEKDGSLSHFKIERSVSMEADSEAMRVMRLSPKWQPIVYKDQAESTRYTVPIHFPK